ncbi:MAG: hypothetical protein RL163_1450 [Pseudomonadota bacterium]
MLGQPGIHRRWCNYACAPRWPPALQPLPTLAWAALFAPAQTPQPLLDKINADFNAAMRDAKVRMRQLKAGAEADPGTQEQMRHRLKAELSKWGKVIKTAGIQVS